MIKNKRVNEWRYRKKALSYFKEEFRRMEYEHIGDGPSKEELQEVLRAGIRGLRPKVREVIELCFFRCKTPDEIAERLKRPVRTVQFQRRQGVEYLLCLPYATKRQRHEIYMRGTNI